MVSLLSNHEQSARGLSAPGSPLRQALGERLLASPQIFFTPVSLDLHPRVLEN